MTRELLPHASHWGAFEAEVADGTVVAIHPYRHDPDPYPLLGNIVENRQLIDRLIASLAPPPQAKRRRSPRIER